MKTVSVLPIINPKCSGCPLLQIFCNFPGPLLLEGEYITCPCTDSGLRKWHASLQACANKWLLNFAWSLYFCIWAYCLLTVLFIQTIFPFHRGHSFQKLRQVNLYKKIRNIWLFYLTWSYSKNWFSRAKELVSS